MSPSQTSFLESNSEQLHDGAVELSKISVIGTMLLAENALEEFWELLTFMLPFAYK